MENSALRDFELQYHARHNQKKLPLFSEGFSKYQIEFLYVIKPKIILLRMEKAEMFWFFLFQISCK